MLLDWFLYDNGLGHERNKSQPYKMVKRTQIIRRRWVCLTISWGSHLTGLDLSLNNRIILLLKFFQKRQARQLWALANWKHLSTELIKTLHNLDPIFIKDLSKPTQYQSLLSAGGKLSVPNFEKVGIRKKWVPGGTKGLYPKKMSACYTYSPGGLTIFLCSKKGIVKQNMVLRAKFQILILVCFIQTN